MAVGIPVGENVFITVMWTVMDNRVAFKCYMYSIHYQFYYLLFLETSWTSQSWIHVFTITIITWQYDSHSLMIRCIHLRIWWKQWWNGKHTQNFKTRKSVDGDPSQNPTVTHIYLTIILGEFIIKDTKILQLIRLCERHISHKTL